MTKMENISKFQPTNNIPFLAVDEGRGVGEGRVGLVGEDWQFAKVTLVKCSIGKYYLSLPKMILSPVKRRTIVSGLTTNQTNRGSFTNMDLL